MKPESKMIRTLKTHRPGQLQKVMEKTKISIGGIFKELNSRKNLALNKSFH